LLDSPSDPIAPSKHIPQVFATVLQGSRFSRLHIAADTWEQSALFNAAAAAPTTWLAAAAS